MSEKLKLKSGNSELTFSCDDLHIIFPNGARLRIYVEKGDTSRVDLFHAHDKFYGRVFISDAGQVNGMLTMSEALEKDS